MYDGTSGLLNCTADKVERYLGVTVRKYNGTSTTVQVRRYYEYYGTPLKCSCNEVRWYLGTTVQVRRYSTFAKSTTEVRRY